MSPSLTIHNSFLPRTDHFSNSLLGEKRLFYAQGPLYLIRPTPSYREGNEEGQQTYVTLDKSLSPSEPRFLPL